MSKFTGRGQLINRLTYQLGGDRNKAIIVLQHQGLLEMDGVTLTPEGRKRDAMTAEERAIDRAVKSTGKPASAFSYDPHSNRVHVKGSFRRRG